jgi:hypothetical protein
MVLQRCHSNQLLPSNLHATTQPCRQYCPCSCSRTHAMYTTTPDAVRTNICSAQLLPLHPHLVQSVSHGCCQLPKLAPAEEAVLAGQQERTREEVLQGSTCKAADVEGKEHLAQSSACRPAYKCICYDQGCDYHQEYGATYLDAKEHNPIGCQLQAAQRARHKMHMGSFMISHSSSYPDRRCDDTSKANSCLMRSSDLHLRHHVHSEGGCNSRAALTCVAAMRISPFFGVHRLLTLPISVIASARASSV